ncbi:MAG: ATP-dependent sacrificial sulfur transferase LarE [Nocardioidaceae bacterium]
MLPPPLVVGFDLDMTLFDTRPGIAAVWRELSAVTGVVVDVDLAVSRLGPPLAVEMANWVPPEEVDHFVAAYLALYADIAIQTSVLMPGAVEALTAVAHLGGQAVLVTAKHAAHARRHLEHAGLDIATVVGDLWGEGKATALRKSGAAVYVGDHVLDVAGARAAGAVSVGVATGPCSADELRGAGADVVLTDLHELQAWLEEYVLEQRLAALLRGLGSLESLLVAFSGGADSAFLLAAAVRALGPRRVVAATALSGSLPVAELEAARAFAHDLGVRHLTPATHEQDRDGYRSNGGDRCWFCKAELLDVLTPLATAHGLAGVATGTNADDARAGFRPGIRAAAERDAVTPLLDAGLSKAQVREVSRRWGLVTWDKPAAACLASRIAYGVEVTPARLSRVERAELALRQALASHEVRVEQLRVRDLGGRARVELDGAATDAVISDAAAQTAALRAVRETGFEEVHLDLAGFRSGSMNELLTRPEQYR